MSEKMRVLSIFDGIAGARQALKELNIDCDYYASEIDKYAIQIAKANHPDIIHIGDVKDLWFDEVEATLCAPQKWINWNDQEKKGDFKSTMISLEGGTINLIDLLIGGFPCQSFSIAGNQKGFADERGQLFFEALRILDEVKPKYFLFENVKGLKSHEGGNTLKIIENSLKELGYTIKWEILNSYDFGLPQYRERWYCVGFKDKINFDFPKGNKRGVKIKSIIDKKANLNKKLRLSEFEIERINFHFNSSEERVQHDNSKYNPNTKKGKHGVFSFQKPDGALRFHIGDVAKTQIQEAFYTCQKTYSPTIIANRVPKLWDLQRKLSVLEAQRLQGFPDSYTSMISNSQSYKALGNSFTVPVIKHILKNIINPI